MQWFFKQTNLLFCSFQIWIANAMHVNSDQSPIYHKQEWMSEWIYVNVLRKVFLFLINRMFS